VANEGKAEIILTADEGDLVSGVERGERALKDLDAAAEKVGGGDGLETLGDAAAKSGKKIDDTRAEIERLEGAFDAAVAKFRSAEAFGEGFEKGSAEAQELRQEIVRAGGAFADFSGKATKGLGATDKELAKVARQTTKARRELERFADSGKKVGTLSNAIGKLGQSVRGLVAVLAVREVAQFVERLLTVSVAALKVKAGLDSLTVGLKETLGGTAAAASGMEFLEGVQERLGVSVAEMGPKFLSLTAALKETSVSGDETRGVFEAITAAGVAFGKTSEEIGRALDAVAQIAGKGQAELEELKGQLGEALPGALGALAKGLKEVIPGFDGTVAGVFELTKKGLDAETALKGLRIGLEDLAGTAADEQMDTLAGAFRQLETAARDIQTAFAEGLEPGFLRLTESMLAQEDGVKRLADGFGTIIGDLVGVESGVSAASLAAEKGARDFGLFAAALDALGMEESAELARGAAEAFGGLGESAKVAFDQIAVDAAKANVALKGTFDESVTSAAEAFNAITEAAQMSADEQVKAAEVSEAAKTSLRQQTADKLAGIADEIFEKAKESEKAITEAAREGEEERLQAVLDAREKVADLQEEQAERQKEAAEEQTAQILRVLQVEHEAAEEAAELDRQRLDSEQAIGEQRAEVAETTESKILEIRKAAAEKAEELLEKEAEAAKKAGADQVEVAEEFHEKRVEVFAEAEKKVQKLIDETTEKTREAAKEREEALAESAETIREVFEDLNESIANASAGETGEGGSPVDRITEGVEKAGEAVEEFKETLDELRLEENFAASADAIFATQDALIRAKLGLEEFITAAEATEEAGSAVDALRGNSEALAEEIRGLLENQELFKAEIVATDNEGGEALKRILATYLELADGGKLTTESANEIREAIKRSITPTKKAGEEMDALARAQAEVAEEAEKAGRGLGDAADEEERLAKGAQQATSAAKGLAEATTDTAKAASNLEKQTAPAASEVDRLATAAAEAADGLGQVSGQASSMGSDLRTMAEQAAAAAGALSALSGQDLSGLKNDLAEIANEANNAADAMARLNKEAAQAASR
jgi:tape measure domain-containing protein